MEQHIIDTGTYDATYNAADHCVNGTVRIYTVTLHLGKAVDHSQKHAKGDNQSVPGDLHAENRERHAIHRNVNTEFGKYNFIITKIAEFCHCPYSFSTTESTTRSGSNRVQSACCTCS